MVQRIGKVESVGVRVEDGPCNESHAQDVPRCDALSRGLIVAVSSAAEGGEMDVYPSFV